MTKERLQKSLRRSLQAATQTWNWKVSTWSDESIQSQDQVMWQAHHRLRGHRERSVDPMDWRAKIRLSFDKWWLDRVTERKSSAVKIRSRDESDAATERPTQMPSVDQPMHTTKLDVTVAPLDQRRGQDSGEGPSFAPECYKHGCPSKPHQRFGTSPPKTPARSACVSPAVTPPSRKRKAPPQ